MRYLILCVIFAGSLISAEGEDPRGESIFRIEPESELSVEYLDCPEGAETIPAYEVIDSSTLPDANDPTSNAPYLTPIERDLRFEAIEQNSRPELDWNGDVLVWQGPVGSGNDFDYDVNTGNLYAVCDTDHFMRDSLLIFCSEDHGETWELYDICVNYDGGICNPKIRIMEDSDGESWLVVMGIWEERRGPDPLWSARQKLSGGSRFWEQIADDVCFADLDADVNEDTNWAYVTYQPAGTEDVWVARNRLNGWGWRDNIRLYQNADMSPQPSIAAGALGTVAVVFLEEHMEGWSTHNAVFMRRSTNQGATWEPYEELVDGGSTKSSPEIALGYSASEVGWFCYQYFLSSYQTYSLRLYSTTDNGVTWDNSCNMAYGGYEAIIRFSEINPSLRASKTTGSLSLCYSQNTDTGVNVFSGWTTASNPTTYEHDILLSDYNVTVGWEACAGWNGNSFSAVLYTAVPDYNLYFDWYSNGAFPRNQSGLSSTGIETDIRSSVTGISNHPNPFSSSTEIAFQLSETAPVYISIYDVSGRVVSTLADGTRYQEGSHLMLWNGTYTSGVQVPAGAYICRITAGSSTETLRMVVAR